MKFNKLIIFSFILSMLSFVGCDKSADETTNEDYVYNFGKPITANFQGKIIDTDKNPLSNVTIKLGSVTTTTNSEGIFTINNATVLERFAYITAQKAGFMQGSRVAIAHDGVNELTIMLLPETVVATVQTGVTSNVTLPNSTRVTFDGAFMKEDGTSYTGNVKVMMHHLSTDDENIFDKMPGTLLAKTSEGEVVGLETYGMLNVELKGDNNEKLQITTGHKANIVLPIGSNQLTTAKATVPLWHFNEVSGVWEEDGFAKKVGNKFYGSVSHFSSWNADYLYPIASLTVVVQNADGSRVNNIRCTLTRVTGSTGTTLIDLGRTNTNGTLTAGVPTNEVLIFRAYTANGTLLDIQNLPSSSVMARTVIVTIAVDNKNSNSNTKK